MQKLFGYVWNVWGSGEHRMRKIKQFLSQRNTIQMLATLLSNIHVLNLVKGTLNDGKTKMVCMPGLNCYSCPAATGACPIGAFQAVTGSSKYSFSYYISGILIFLGVVFGRLICGFLCPFGWFQDLLYKIPTRKFSTKGLTYLRCFKYVMLIVCVCILPVLMTNDSGMGSPFFCKYVCPQGVLEGAIPLAIAKESIRSSLGVLFSWKAGILAVVVVLSIFFYRPFCKWICPLGAFYSLFNKVSIYHYQLDKEKCISCGKCSRTCQMDVDITQKTNHAECIRCGACIKACPAGAITANWNHRQEQK